MNSCYWVKLIAAQINYAPKNRPFWFVQALLLKCARIKEVLNIYVLGLMNGQYSMEPK